MTLIDRSAWVYYRSDGGPPVQEAVAEAIEDDMVANCRSRPVSDQNTKRWTDTVTKSGLNRS